MTEPNSEEIRRIVNDTLRLTVPAFQRRLANKLGVRETDKINCDHEWCPIKRWCVRCGQTQENVFFHT